MPTLLEVMRQMEALQREAFMALGKVVDLDGLTAWRKKYVLSKPRRDISPGTAVESFLYTTFIAHAGILDWEIHGPLHVRSALVDEAYGRWLVEAPAAAEYYADVWAGTVSPVANGYQVSLYKV